MATNTSATEVFEKARKRLEVFRSLVDEPDRKKPGHVYAGLRAIMNVKDSHRQAVLQTDKVQHELEAALQANNEARLELENEEFHLLWLQQIIRDVESEDLDTFKEVSKDWQEVHEFPKVLRQLKGELEEREKMEETLKQRMQQSAKEARALDAQKKMPKEAIKKIQDMRNVMMDMMAMYNIEPGEKDEKWAHQDWITLGLHKKQRWSKVKKEPMFAQRYNDS